MRRTTVAIEESLLRRLKERAASEGRTLQAVLNDLLRRALAARDGPPFRLELEGWVATEQPGVDVTDRDNLFDLMERG